MLEAWQKYAMVDFSNGFWLPHYWQAARYFQIIFDPFTHFYWTMSTFFATFVKCVNIYWFSHSWYGKGCHVQVSVDILILSCWRADSSFLLIKKLKKFKTWVEFRLKPRNYNHAKLGAKTHGRPFLWHCQNSICTL